MADMQEIDLSLLDKNLEDIEDLPSFEVPPEGSYTFLVNASTKSVNDHPAVTLDFEVVDTLKLAKPADKPAVPGTKFNTLYMLDNEFGMGNMKKALSPFAEHFGTNNVRTLVLEKIQNVVVAATLKHRKDKSDPEKVYADVRNIVVS